jgi:hypothetical protein
MMVLYMTSTRRTGIAGGCALSICYQLMIMRRRCEYILYRGLYRTAYARISRGIVTDTELQIGQFVVPRHGFQLVNQTLEDRMLRAWKEDLPEDHVWPEYYLLAAEYC